MSLRDWDEQRFLRAYRVALLGSALGWRTTLVVGLTLPAEASSLVIAVLVLYGWGLAPYLALAALAARADHRGLLLTSGVLLLGGDVLSGTAVLWPESSTSAVVLFTYPLFAMFGLIPIVWLVDKLLGR